MRTLLALMCLAAGTLNATEPPIKDPRVTLDTSAGKIVLRLFPDKAPDSVKNFLDYVDAGFYDGLVFHRVIPGFMIQGGGYDKDLTLKAPRTPIQNEASNGLKNRRGSIAMARTGEPHSATSQFFVNLVDNTFLDHTDNTPRGMGYCVFGEVLDGMAIVDAIAKTKTQCPSSSSAPCTAKIPPGMADVPATPVIIKSAKRTK